MIIPLLIVLAQSAPGQWEASALRPIPAAIADGSALAAAGNGEDLYLTRGNGSTEFRRYSITADLWTRLADTPRPGSRGDALVYAGANGLYASFGLGGTSPEFWRYSITADRWDAMAPAPSAFNVGKLMVVTGATSIHAVTTRTDEAKHGSPLSRYSIPDNRWDVVADLPFDAFSGSALAFDGADTLFVTRGFQFMVSPFSPTPEIQAFSLSSRTWTRMRDCGGGFGYGAFLHHPGFGKHLYAFTGGNGSISDPDANRFWAYSVQANEWTPIANAPGRVDRGSSLAYGGSGAFLYATAGEAAPTSFWRYTIEVDPPTILSIAQAKLDGSTALPTGGATIEPGFTAKIQATDSSGDPVEIQVEVQPVGTAFTDTASRTRPVAIGATSVAITGLPVGVSFHWQARAVNSRGGRTAWLPFGGNAETEADFRTRSNSAPALLQVRQRLASTGAEFLPGGRDDGGGLLLEATGADADDDAMSAEFEIQPLGVSFSGSATDASAPFSGAAPGSLIFKGGKNRYHWQARLVDALGAAGPWMPFGANGEGEADFELEAAGSVGGNACAGSAASSPGTAAVLIFLAILVLRRR